MDSAGEVIPPQAPTELPRSRPAPWATSVTIHTEPINFEEVMSEQLASYLHDMDFGPTAADSPPSTASSASEQPVIGEPPPPPDECKDDLMLARLLQDEFDQEHDAFLRQEERKYNGSSKIQLSFNKFRKTSAPLEKYDISVTADDNDEEEDSDEFEKDEENWPTIGCQGGVAAAKSAKVFHNNLRERSEKAGRRQRLHDKKEKQTNDVAMDVNTKLLLYKLVSKGVLEDVTGCVSTGKEAHVYHGVGGPGCQRDDDDEEEEVHQPRNVSKDIPADCAIKVFKTTIMDFKNRAQYIDEDCRFKNRMKALNNHKYINLWAEKEMYNLNRLCKAGVPCPQVVSLKKHVLVMSFIGSGHLPAPKLKEAQLSNADLGLAYNQTVSAMVTMYRDCRLVHADLSEYNLLWQDSTVFVIDLGQAVDLSHPHCLEFLYRDCTNVAAFFSRKGHTPALAPHLLFTHVTQLSFPGEEGVEFLNQIRNFEVEKAESMAACKKKAPKISIH